MKHVDVAELLVSAPAPMTRREKLLRWAGLVRQSKIALVLYSNLEHWSQDRLEHAVIQKGDATAFELATADPVFQSQGLASETNLPKLMTFFEIGQEELHGFACDCGGMIDRQTMADRIEALA